MPDWPNLTAPENARLAQLFHNDQNGGMTRAEWLECSELCKKVRGEKEPNSYSFAVSQ